MKAMRRAGDTRELLDLMRAYHAAMVQARTDMLAQLVDDDYSLVHVTGYVQPRNEWFDVIGSGAYDYHKIDVDHRTLQLDVAGASATLEGRGVFDATIEGLRRPWLLQFALRCTKQAGRWRVECARYVAV